MAKAHINLEANECTSCKLHYPAIDQLMQHMALHFHWFRFQCCKCKFMFFEKSDCKSHIVCSHADIKGSAIDTSVVQLPHSKMETLWTEFKELDFVDGEKQLGSQMEKGNNIRVEGKYLTVSCANCRNYS